MRRTLEEECNGDLQDLRDVLESTRADAVGAFLVFLYLLKRDAERIAELRLAHAEHHPAHAYAAADVPVDRVWGLLGHLLRSRFAVGVTYRRKANSALLNHLGCSRRK